jgi:Cu/Zn superoxide dismutase
LKRITKAALGGVAGCALVLGGTQLASGLDNLRILEDARVLQPDKMLDDAKANITINKTTDSTTFSIRVTGIDVSGIDFSKPVPPLGSHLHIGKCVKGNMGGTDAGPHYNHDVHFYHKAFPKPGELPSDTVAEVSPDTEVWFDLVPDQGGTAYDQTTVLFVPVDSDGEMSVVVHVDPTNPDTGAAGLRQACFPLDVSQTFATPPPPPAE